MMKTNLTNKEYWILRQDQRLEEVEALGGKGINEIVGVYDDSLKRVEKEINTILRNYAKNSNISIESLKEFLTESEQSGLLERLQLSMYNTGVLDKQTEKWLKTNYQFRLDRQTALKQQLEAERIMVLKQERAISKKLYSKGIEQTYSSLTKDLIGASKDISDAVKESMLTKRWIADNNYSERIWNNTGQLKNDLDQMLNATNLAGRNPQQLINDLKDRYEVSQHQAARLVRTEMNYFHNQTTLKGYEDAGIEEYEYSAVRDNRTSAVCSDMDGNKHKIKDAEPGVNYPPMHPNCRSTTLPVIPGFEEVEERRYKNSVTRESEITNLPFDDWNEKQRQSYKDGPEAYDLEIKKLNNLYVDKKQHKRYLDVVGIANIPKNIADFQHLKYNEVDKWIRLQDNYYVKSRLKDGRFGSIINPEKQAPHMQSTAPQGKSYFFDGVDVQMLFILFAGTGKVFKNKKGLRSHIEIVEYPYIIGYDAQAGKFTNKAKIHHSKNRTHIVPYAEKEME